MSSRGLNVCGLNRGAAAVIVRLAPKTASAFRQDWRLADPKEGRANRMAALIRQRFPDVAPVPFQADALSLVRHSEDTDATLLTMDTVEDTHAVVRAKRPMQTTSYQLVGQGPGGVTGTRIGIIGTVQPGNSQTERQAALFFEGLGRVTKAASSKELTNSPLTGMVLSQIRHTLAHRTVAHLEELERDPWDLPGGPLSIFLGNRMFPLVPVEVSQEDNYRQRVEQARQAVDALPAGQLRTFDPTQEVIAGVLTADSPRIELMTVRATSKGHRDVAGVTVFSDPVEAAAQEPARFTD